jgi:hypothetical protein
MATGKERRLSKIADNDGRDRETEGAALPTLERGAADGETEGAVAASDSEPRRSAPLDRSADGETRSAAPSVFERAKIATRKERRRCWTPLPFPMSATASRPITRLLNAADL